MKSVVVKFNNEKEVENFVQIVSKYNFDIDLRSSKYVINAKSLLGILGLNSFHPCVLEIYADNCETLLDEIDKYIQ